MTDAELRAIFLSGDREAYQGALLVWHRERREIEIFGVALGVAKPYSWTSKSAPSPKPMTQPIRASAPPTRVSMERVSASWERLEEVARLCDDAERWIEGVATTPRASAHSWAVDPLGAQFALPLPLCLNHDRKRRVGWVTEAIKSPASLAFRARLVSGNASFPEADGVWDSIVDGKLRGVSIGGLSANAQLQGPGDRIDVEHFATKWSWSELTVCELGANPDAKIQRALLREPGREREWIFAGGAR